MTQAFPTNFHTFLTSKILTTAESIADWMEVNAAERARLEAVDALWQRPPQWLIDLWNMVCGANGKYNTETGYFELNGLTDISCEEAIAIMAYYRPVEYGDTCEGMFSACKTRTLCPIVQTQSVSFSRMFQNANNLEKVILVNYNALSRVTPTSMSWMFDGCSKLKSVEGILDLENTTSTNLAFRNCTALIDIKIINLKNAISFENSPLLSLETVRFLIDNAANTAPISISVHVDVYAKLTDPGNVEWYELNRKAIEKQISFASA